MNVREYLQKLIDTATDLQDYCYIKGALDLALEMGVILSEEYYDYRDALRIRLEEEREA